MVQTRQKDLPTISDMRGERYFFANPEEVQRFSGANAAKEPEVSRRQNFRGSAEDLAHATYT